MSDEVSRECRAALASPFPPSVYTPCSGLRGGGGVAVLEHPWLDQDPPVRDSPLETGPHRHASNLSSSRFAGRPTQADALPAIPTRPPGRGATKHEEVHAGAATPEEAR